MKLLRGIKGCLGSIVSGLMLVAVAYGGWRWGDAVFPRLEEAVQEFRGDAVVSSGEEGSPEIGARAAERLEGLRDGSGSGQESFDGSELTSLLRHTYAERVPTAIGSPRVRIEDGRATLLGSVALADVPSFPDLGDVMAILPDTLQLEARGSLIPLDGQGAAFLVDRLEAGGIPLPRRLIPGVLGAFGREDRPGLPREAIQLSLPEGIGAAYIEGDLLVLRAED